MDPARCAVGIGHQRDQARMLDALAVGALVVEAQAVGDLGGEPVDRDLAGLGEVALGQRAGDRLAAVPQRQGALAVGRLLVVDRSDPALAVPLEDQLDRLGPGHALGLGQPVDASAVSATAVAVEMIGVEHGTTDRCRRGTDR